MSIRLRTAMSALACVVVASLMFTHILPPFASARANTQSPKVQLERASGAPGETIRLSGSYFPASESGSVFWDDQMFPIGMTRTDDFGRTSALVTIPDVPEGRYLVRTVIGNQVASVQLEVTTSLLSGRTQDADASETPATSADPPTEQVTDVPTDVPVETETTEPTATQIVIPTETEDVPDENPTDAIADVTDTVDALSAPSETATPSASPTETPSVERSAQDRLILAAVADAYVALDSPESNYGSGDTLKSDKSPQTETYLRFDVEAGDSVSRAILRLYAINGSGSSSEIYVIAPEWTEDTVSWANRPAIISDRIAMQPSIEVNNWVEFDISTLVTGSGSYNLVIFNPHSDGLEFYSREGLEAPQLIIESGDSTVPTVQLTPTTASSDPELSLSASVAGGTIDKAQKVKISAEVGGNVGETSVEFSLDGKLVQTDDTAPFETEWDVTQALNGEHTWEARLNVDGAATSIAASIDIEVAIAGARIAAASDATLTAAAETNPVHHSGDAADDPTIWLHPTDLSKSTIIGTDKLGGLAVYSLSGTELFYYADSSPNNVDLRYNFPLNGVATTIVVTSDRTTDLIRVYRVNPTTRGLEYIGLPSIDPKMGVAGIALYVSAVTGKYYVFVCDSSGNVQQWELFGTSAGKVDGKRVRSFSLSSMTEGMVADDGTGALYISQEDVALWKYGAEPGAGTSRTKIDSVGSGGHLTADVEGLAIYYGGAGYLIASSQGSNNYAVYQRGSGAYVGQFAIVSGTVDEVTNTDGLDVTNVSLGGKFGNGLLVVQDGTNNGGNQNFKLVPWNAVAKAFGTDLAIDTSFDPRAVGPDGGVQPPVDPQPVTYYVDSVSGNDSNAGTSTVKPWKSLAKVNGAALKPGDKVLFKRGSTWSGKLEIARSGESGKSITLGAYGTGAAPIITGTSTCIRLSGSYLVLQDMTATDCTWAGVEVVGDRNFVRRLLVSKNVVGIYVKPGASYNRLVSNVLKDNNKMSVLTNGGSDDSGAFGVLLKGDYTEVSYNTISGSDAFSYDYGRDGAAIEIYGARMSHIHHNIASNNDAFTELGNSRSYGNKYSYNLVTSSLATSVFLVTRGSGSSYGPIAKTVLYNNTVVLTGASSQGFVCSSGCGPGILRMRNNVIQAVLKVGYADHAFDEDYNLYYGGITQFTLGSHSKVANPRFVNAGSGDYRLASNSPAIDKGIATGYDSDLDGAVVPQDGNGDGKSVTDLGAFEY